MPKFYNYAPRWYNSCRQGYNALLGMNAEHKFLLNT